MTALVRYRDDIEPARVREPGRTWVELMAPAAELAKAVAPTEFVPKALRHNVPAITACIMYGDEVGLGPMQSLALISVIEGRPFMAAEAQRGLIYAAGHHLWLEESSTVLATWCGQRRGADEVTRITWRIDDAERAGLKSKPNWRAYPRAMLSARASADLARAVFADVVRGIAALEELDGLDQLEPAQADTGSSRTRRRRGKAGAAADTAAPAVEAVTAVVPRPLLPNERTEADAPADDLMSEPQRKRMMRLMTMHGYGGSSAADRARRLALTREVIGSDLLASSKELTQAEAGRVIQYLEGLRPPAENPPDAPGPVAAPTDEQAPLR